LQSKLAATDINSVLLRQGTHIQGRKPALNCERTTCAGSLGRGGSPLEGSRGGAPVGGLVDEEAEAILYFYGEILTNLTVYFSALID